MDQLADLWQRANRVIPGGVNSPVRAFRGVGGDPLMVQKAEGAWIWDTHGHRMTDYIMSWGALLLGHAHPAVTAALEQALKRGTSYGMTCPDEVELAELVVELVPSVDVVRFVNSGTEATMSAVRLARAATDRKLVLKFEGCYHGHGDGFLVAAGSGVATLGLPDSPGVPEEIAHLTLVSPYNDMGAVEKLIDQHGDDLAAIIVEPFVGNSGFIPPEPDFLPQLRQAATDAGAILIFDEVMTGFRVHPGGAQGLLQVNPDLTTLGKVIGGGLPVGAYGGRRELMERVAPAGPVYQAGTLSGNPLAMAAGLAALRAAHEQGAYEILEGRTRNLVEGLTAAAEDLKLPFTASHAGSMWGVFFRQEPVRSFADAKASDTELFQRFHREARELGILLAPSPFEAGFLSLAHTDEIVFETVEVLAQAMARATQS